MLDIVNVRQPGRPYVFSQGCEYAVQLITKEGKQMRHRESDGIIVLKKAGNAAGGKDAT